MSGDEAPGLITYRTLGDLADSGYWWSPFCPTCNKSFGNPGLDIRDHAERYGRDMTFDDFRAKLTCSVCGTRCPTGVGAFTRTASQT